MDDLNAFERLVAEETQAAAGPSRPTDVAAVVRSVATKSPIWRFWSMFTATKTLAATTVLALIGGFLLIGPLQEGLGEDAIVPAAESSEPRMDPVPFEARWSYGDTLSGRAEIEIRDDGWQDVRNIGVAPYVIVPGDERLDGQLTLLASNRKKDGIEIWSGSFRIELADGAWQQPETSQWVQIADDRSPSTWTAVFHGSGAYEGLTAVMAITHRGGGWDVEGVIVDGALPDAPAIEDFYG